MKRPNSNGKNKNNDDEEFEIVFTPEDQEEKGIEIVFTPEEKEGEEDDVEEVDENLEEDEYFESVNEFYGDLAESYSPENDEYWDFIDSEEFREFRLKKAKKCHLEEKEEQSVMFLLEKYKRAHDLAKKFGDDEINNFLEFVGVEYIDLYEAHIAKLAIENEPDIVPVELIEPIEKIFEKAKNDLFEALSNYQKRFVITGRKFKNSEADLTERFKTVVKKYMVISEKFKNNKKWLKKNGKLDDIMQETIVAYGLAKDQNDEVATTYLIGAMDFLTNEINNFLGEAKKSGEGEKELGDEE